MHGKLTKIGTETDEKWDFHPWDNGVILQGVGCMCSRVSNWVTAER